MASGAEEAGRKPRVGLKPCAQHVAGDREHVRENCAAVTVAEGGLESANEISPTISPDRSVATLLIARAYVEAVSRREG